MKQPMNRLILLASLLLPLNVLANTYERYEPIPTTKYLETQGVLESQKEPINLRFGVEGIYGPVGDNSFTYAEQGVFDPIPFSLQPKNTLNFRIALAYEINEKLDIGVNWLHLRSDTNDSVMSDIPDLFLPENPTNGIDTGFTRIDGQIQTRLDAINLEIARSWRAPCLPTSLAIRAFTGVQYTTLKVETETVGTSAISAPGSLTTQSRYNGIGPRVGTEIFYEVVENLEVIGSVAGNLLFGNLKWEQMVMPPGDPFLTSEERQSKAIFGLETKVGLGYTININRSKLSLEGGYQWASYFDAVRNINFDKEDFTYHGPYFAIRLAV